MSHESKKGSITGDKFDDDEARWQNFELRFTTAIGKNEKQGWIIDNDFMLTTDHKYVDAKIKDKQNKGTEAIDELKEEYNILTPKVFKAQNKEIYRHLVESVSDKVLDKFKNKVEKNQGIEAWRYLSQYYNSKEVITQLSLFLLICKRKQAHDQKVKEYATDFHNSISTLNAMGFATPQHIRFGLFVANLHSRYGDQLDAHIHASGMTEEKLTSILSANDTRKEITGGTTDNEQGGTSFWAGNNRPNFYNNTNANPNSQNNRWGAHGGGATRGGGRGSGRGRGRGSGRSYDPKEPCPFCHENDPHHPPQACWINPQNKNNRISEFKKAWDLNQHTLKNTKTKNAKTENKAVTFFARKMLAAHAEPPTGTKAVFLDSGCDNHYFKDADNLRAAPPVSIGCANGTAICIDQEGTCGRFQKVLHNKALAQNLASIGRIACSGSGKIAIFGKKHAKIFDAKDVKILELGPPVAVAQQKNFLYVMQEPTATGGPTPTDNEGLANAASKSTTTTPPANTSKSTTTTPPANTSKPTAAKPIATSEPEVRSKTCMMAHNDKSAFQWHQRLCHVSINVLSDMIARRELPSVSKISKEDRDLILNCQHCRLAKSKKKPFPTRKPEKKITKHFHTLCSDVCGNITPCGVGGYRFYNLTMDSGTGLIWKDSLQFKSAATECVIEKANFIEKRFEKQIHGHHSDQGGEYKNEKMTTFLKSKHAKQTFTNTDCSSQNEAEVAIKTINARARVMLIDSPLGPQWWPLATDYAVLLENRMPKSRLGNKSPYVVATGLKPDFKNFLKFGCTVFVHVTNKNSEKHHARAKKCMFVGIPKNSHGILVLDPTRTKRHRVYSVKHYDVTAHTLTILPDSEEEQGGSFTESGEGSSDGNTPPTPQNTPPPQINENVAAENGEISENDEISGDDGVGVVVDDDPIVEAVPKTAQQNDDLDPDDDGAPESRYPTRARRPTERHGMVYAAALTCDQKDCKIVGPHIHANPTVAPSNVANFARRCVPDNCHDEDDRNLAFNVQQAAEFFSSMDDISHRFARDVPTPKSVKQALAADNPYRNLWLQAMRAEFNSYLSMKAFELKNTT